MLNDMVTRKLSVEIFSLKSSHDSNGKIFCGGSELKVIQFVRVDSARLTIYLKPIA